MPNRISPIIRNILCVLLSIYVAFWPLSSFAQTATLLPNGEQQFFDSNGNPLTSGTVDFYIPNTSTRKNTWKDAAETILNTNPVVLDAGGRAVILGDGAYRQVLKDRLGNLIWDKPVVSFNSGGTIITTGDGDLVGTIKPWAGFLAPNQYAFAYGQEISRTTFAALLTAITQTITVICTSTSNVFTGLTDTTQIPIGAKVELSCVPSGTTVVSKTGSSVTLSNPSNVSINAAAIFFPYGDGNGTTTFNLPDLRGYVVAGRDNMGGSAANRFGTFFGTNTSDAIGATGGNSSQTLLISNLASHNHVDSGHNHVENFAINGSGTSYSSINAGSATQTFGHATNIATGQPTTTDSGTANIQVSGGGIAVSASVSAAGSGYTTGTQTLTVSGGTCTTQPQFSVTVSGGTIATPVLVTAGSCSVTPSNPAATTGGGGTDGTLTIIYSALPFSIIQPTFTLNYIIKVTPDSSAQQSSGVSDLGGMTGSIGCGSGLLCTGNVVSIVSGGGVDSFNGRIGTVVPATNDYSFAQVSGIAGLAQGGLGGSQAAATVNQIPVYPGAAGAAVPTSAPTWFDSAYCNTVGYLIVRIASKWTCNNSIPANVDWFANVAGDGASDDTAGINTVLAAVNGIVNFSSKVYCIKTAAGLTSTMQNQIIQGSAATLISACGTDTNLLTINNDSIQVRNLSFLGSPIGVASNHHVIVMGSACVRCRVDHVITAGGYYNLLINAAYTFVYDLRTGNGHGPAVIKMLSAGGSFPGLYLDSAQIDQNWPVSAPSNLASISAWTNGHVYNAGDVVSNSGFYIQARVGGTSAGSAPTNLDYGNDIADGAVLKWRLVAPTTFDGLSADTGSINVVVTRTDFTGPYTNGIHIHNSAAGAAPLEIDLGVGNTFAQNLTSCINAQAGSVLTISAMQCQSGVMAATIGVWLQSTFGGLYQINTSTFSTLGNSSDGILDQASANNGGSITDNLIYTGGGTGISIGANINNRIIKGNHGGTSSLGTNASCIFVSPGTGDYLTISNNECNGASSSQITIASVTGTHNTISNNGTYGACNTGSVGFIQSPFININFNVAGDNSIPIQLPIGCTRIFASQLIISNASADIHTATFGVFTATGGGGTAILAAGQAITVTATADNTNNNAQLVNVTNLGTESYTPVANLLYFRVGSTVAGTGNVAIQYRPIP